MKIVIIQGAFFPVPTVRGGAVGKVWYGLAREFARLGHEVLHVTRLCDGLPAEEVIDGVHYERVPGHDAPRSMVLMKWHDLVYTRRVVARLPKADVVVTNTFWAPMLLRPKHHGRVWVHVQRYPKGQMRFYRHAARLQTVSNVIARAIVEQCPRLADRVRVIPNPLPAVAPPARAVVKDPNLILFVGRVHPEKGLELLVRAMLLLRQQHPAAHLRIVGPWDEKQGGGGAGFAQRLVGLAAHLGSAVAFAGPVFDEAVLSAHYEEAAVFVYPTLAAKGEASPVAPLEALAHGLPVVVSDLACFDDYLPRDCGERFNHNAASAPARLAGVLGRILEHPEHWPATARAARAHADNFSLPRVARHYLDGFEAMLAEPLPA